MVKAEREWRGERGVGDWEWSEGVTVAVYYILSIATDIRCKTATDIGCN